MCFEPGEQGRTEIETNVAVIVDYFSLGSDMRKGVWPVTLTRNSLIPIVVGCGARLSIDLTRPGILAWWLIEVAVND